MDTKKLKKYLEILQPFLWVILPFIGIVAVLFVIILNANNDNIYDKVSDEAVNIETNTIEITFINSEDKESKITAEVADSAYERAYGLMNRQTLPWEGGMIFMFDSSQVLEFWMKNTYISLDIIFLDSNKQIIKIHKNVQPLDTSKRYSSDIAAKYAIEINGGWIEYHNIKTGDQVYF